MRNLRAFSERPRGMTLVELLVAVTIGLVVTLAVTTMIILGEQHRRATTSANEMAQSGSFAIYQLDRAVRSAGSALVQSANLGVFGCRLNAGAILPRATPFPEPFRDNFLTAAAPGNTSNLRVAPVLIGKAMSDDDVSDVVVVMRGNGNAGGIPRRISDPGSATLLKVESSVGFAANDVLLVSQAGTTDCLIEQITAVGNHLTNPGELTLGGHFYTAGTGSATIANLGGSTSTYVSPLGSSSAGSVQFSMYGVGANSTLFSYDLLRVQGGDVAQAIADGVQELHALYGLDVNGDGVLDSWADPGAAGYDIATVMTTPATIRQIVAVRLALVLRSSALERSAVTPNCDGNVATVQADCTPYRYFSGLSNTAGTSLERELNTSALQNVRVRVIETTIPLRNMQLIPAAS